MKIQIQEITEEHLRELVRRHNRTAKETRKSRIKKNPRVPYEVISMDSPWVRVIHFDALRHSCLVDGVDYNHKMKWLQGGEIPRLHLKIQVAELLRPRFPDLVDSLIHEVQYHMERTKTKVSHHIA